MQSENPHKERVVVIREGLVSLTGHHISAILLNQLLYWQDRVRDVDDYLEEESLRRSAAQEPELPDIKTHGWIYKSATQLGEETMLSVSEDHVRDYLKKLVDSGWISERRNPRIKFDKTLQYRCDIPRIQAGLRRIGFELGNFRLHHQANITNLESAHSGTNPPTAGAIPESTSENQREPRPSFATLTTDVERTNPEVVVEAPTKCAPDINVVLEKMRVAREKHVTAEIDASECWTLVLHLYREMWGYKMSPGDKRNVGAKIKRYGESLVAKGIYDVWASGNWPREIEYIWAAIDNKKQEQVYQEVKKERLFSNTEVDELDRKHGLNTLIHKYFQEVKVLDADGKPIHLLPKDRKYRQLQPIVH